MTTLLARLTATVAVLVAAAVTLTATPAQAATLPEFSTFYLINNVTHQCAARHPGAGAPRLEMHGCTYTPNEVFQVQSVRDGFSWLVYEPNGYCLAYDADAFGAFALHVCKDIVFRGFSFPDGNLSWRVEPAGPGLYQIFNAGGPKLSLYTPALTALLMQYPNVNDPNAVWQLLPTDAI
ncbi:RICIN domain-containing protein [Cryptosporangium sp. NPDC051539]|uniref:RICIN domain-containing protein n=1 Tax=Cryptosporangium sp. NPDC051539 TaxID=3363962 RepID=UPI003790C8EA